MKTAVYYNHNRAWSRTATHQCVETAPFCHKDRFQKLKKKVFEICSCYGLQKLLDICNEYGCSWDIKFNPNKSYAGTLGGDHPTSMNPVLAGKPLQWAVQLKYFGCTIRCRSCDIGISCFVSKYYGAFNNIMRVLGSKRNEIVAVHWMKSFCLPTLLWLQNLACSCSRCSICECC